MSTLESIRAAYEEVEASELVYKARLKGLRGQRDTAESALEVCEFALSQVGTLLVGYAEALGGHSTLPVTVEADALREAMDAVGAAHATARVTLEEKRASGFDPKGPE